MENPGPVGAIEWAVAMRTAQALGYQVYPVQNFVSLERMIERGRLTQVAILDGQAQGIVDRTGGELKLLRVLGDFSLWLVCSPGTPESMRKEVGWAYDQYLASGDLRQLMREYGYERYLADPPPK